MRAVMTRARGVGIEVVAFGDLFLADIRRYREDRMRGTPGSDGRTRCRWQRCEAQGGVQWSPAVTLHAFMMNIGSDVGGYTQSML